VLKIIVSGYVDAIVGVACLNVLEKAIDKILLAGIPCMAVPLLSSDCRNTSVDEDWVQEMIHTPYLEQKPVTRSFVHLLRGASQLFQPDELERLAPRQRREIRLSELKGNGVHQLDPIAGTRRSPTTFSPRRKHLRPLSRWRLRATGPRRRRTGRPCHSEWPDHVKRAAMSIETFHKASLVHDDIEDSDQYRYGSPALHCTYGIPTAINVGDYLIGLGYRLVSREAATMGGDCAATVLNVLADSHQRLSEGQGAELLWREAPNKRISPVDALRIYALKTAPAFEAAFLTGIRLAGSLDGYFEPIKKLSRDLGIAFQILNDLADWQGDNHNKMSRALDLIGGRPTVLWALALQDLNDAGRSELERLVADNTLADAYRVQRAGQLYFEAGVCEKAYRLVDKYQQRAEETAAQIQLEPLRDVLSYLVDLVLERHDDASPTIQFIEPSSLSQAFPVTPLVYPRVKPRGSDAS
jgi:geranylgeranyl pyrophosphate synthase